MPIPDFSFNNLPQSLPILPLITGVLLPGAVLTLGVGRPGSVAAIEAASNADNLIIVAVQPDRKSESLLPVATLGRIVGLQQERNGTYSAAIQGLCRVEMGNVQSLTYKSAYFEAVRSPEPTSKEFAALKSLFAEKALPVIGCPQKDARYVENFDLFVDAVAMTVEADDASEFRKEVLITADLEDRTNLVLSHMVRSDEMIAAKKAVESRVQEETQNMQRQFVLRQQMDAIRKELGEMDGESGDELANLRAKVKEKDLPEECLKAVERELSRAERIPSHSPERSASLDWLERVIELPWNEESAVDVDLDALEGDLNKSHFGLEEVKEQVVEYLAVRKLAGSGRADVLCLAGPPGVGKTSIAQAIADATGRKLVRIALGGVRDEAELRGHRRTYIGSRPGRIIEGIRKAGTSDPVILFDEVDKLSRSHNGNPEAALLEILDPEQNHAFQDHYLEMPFDLSKALFVATANSLGSISGPLRDRMEILQIEGYTRNEKLEIANGHLLPRLAKNAGLEEDAVTFEEGAIAEAISGWTREAGVRQLQRVLGKAYRKAAVQHVRGNKDAISVTPENVRDWLGKRKYYDDDKEEKSRVGLVAGLAWTAVGGDVLYVEATLRPGKGKAILTGQLGDVMKESAQAAMTFAMQHLEVTFEEEKKDIHIHFPAGAIPKDGPSAGVTMFTAVVSLLTNTPVRHDVAMTGEASLRGRVLPIGGVKSKVLAAHRMGMKKVLLPDGNKHDIEDIPEEVRNDIEIVTVKNMTEVLEHALDKE